MTRAELVDQVSEKTGATKTETDNIIIEALKTITEALSEGDSVRLKNFGTFKVKTIAAHKAFNPKTNDYIDLKEVKKIKFIAGKSLSDACNNDN